jgi:hypothetical protein
MTDEQRWNEGRFHDMTGLYGHSYKPALVVVGAALLIFVVLAMLISVVG